ncbi:Outer membrane protein TolC [Bryocella elongata]|uniref:Outer membrane protein TolC n=1 Tax=Bryocella elongata TaxID=863522 RepID=A0A1H5Z3I5_9BACT|nr:TolC family protein [Bryocella elongata]SEG30832.1 Outer membrane protein TolC [Bryocella elongata]
MTPRNFVTASIALLALPYSTFVAAQQASFQSVQAPQPVLRLDIPHSSNPFNAYRASNVARPNLANTPRIDSLVHDGVLQLSLSDAIALALENNLDIAIARYNLPIAAADVLRTRAGGVFRGVNTGVVQNTPGGGVGGFGSSSSGAGAGGTSGGAGGAGTGASGLVQSTLGTGTDVSSYDPTFTANTNLEHYTEPLSNLTLYNVPVLRTNTIVGNFHFSQAFASGTTLSVTLDNDRVTNNSQYTLLTPEIDTYYRVLFQQQLLAGFGLGPNLRYLRIAKNNQKISDQAFKLQIISTITQIEDLYWDLVSAYEDERVKSASLDFANQTLDTARKELKLEAIPAIDVLKDEGEVANRQQDLTIARSQLQFQELLIKNALTKNLDDPTLEAMPVQPTDLSTVSLDAAAASSSPTEDIIQQALTSRIELSESKIDLQSRDMSLASARNALLPTLALTAYYGGTGLGGPANPASHTTSTAPGSYSGALSNAFNNSAPDYYVGLSLTVPIRNRIAKSDQYRAELESRQAELRLAQLRKQIRIEVRNAQYALDQSQARVQFANKARELAQRTFEITAKEQSLGAGSALQTLAARHDVATAESALVAARTAYQKARVELDRAVGRTLEANAISVESARTGVPPSQATQP